MSFELRGYQDQMIRATREALRRHQAVLLQAPTGAGKTALAAFMVGSTMAKKKRAGFICHRQELIEQTKATFDKVGIPAGIIASGYPMELYQPIQICSIDTLKRRLNKVEPFDLLVWDECHHVAAGGWSRVMASMSNSRHVGLTATPERLDGKGLDSHFSAMVRGPSVSWLIDRGFLSDYKVFAPSMVDTSGLHTRMGDFRKDEASEMMNKPVITGDAVEHYLRHTPGQQAAAFCVGIEHSMAVAAQFNAAGIRAAHIDGSMNKLERKTIINAYRRGLIKVLTNVDIIGEGFDLPAISVSILLRPTQSLALYLQQVGRSLRPEEGKAHATILDHAGNVMRHGLPDDDREWSLQGREKREAASNDNGPPVRQCPQCYFVHAPGKRSCPECGHVYMPEQREIEYDDGDLKELDKEALRKKQDLELKQAKTLDALIELGRRRGYRFPESFAAKIMTKRAAWQRERAAHG